MCMNRNNTRGHDRTRLPRRVGLVVSCHAAPMAERDLFFAHARGRASKSLLCARCAQPAASVALQLPLATGEASRKALSRRHEQCNVSNRCLPVQTGNTPIGGPYWCESGCLEAYCSAQCREAHRAEHALLCDGGLLSGAPLKEFHKLARRQPTESLILAAHIAAWAVTCDEDLLSEGTNESQKQRAAAVGRSVLEECADDGCMADEAPRHSDGVEGDTLEDVEAREEREELDELDSAVEEAWTLLHVGMLERIPSCAREAVTTLLDRSLFFRLVGAIERRMLPLQMPNPLAEYCTALGARCDWAGDAAAAGDHVRALQLVLSAVHTMWGGGASSAVAGTSSSRRQILKVASTASAQLDALLTLEAADAANDMNGAGASNAPGDEIAVRMQRRACLIAQAAPRLFPPCCLVAFARSAARVPHSCVPNAQLQLLPHGASSSAATQGAEGTSSAHAQSLPPLPQAELVPLRPRQEGEQETSVAWVDVTQADVDERHAALRKRLGAHYLCKCERCEYERPIRRRGGAGNIGSGGGAVGMASMALSASPPLVMLARDAIEDGRYSEAIAMLRARVASEKTDGRMDGDAWMLMGTALLNADKWTSAHSAWRRGAVLAPTHALLQTQRRKDALYCRDVEGEGTSDLGGEAARNVDAPAACEVHLLPGGGASCKMAVTVSPLFTPSECAEAIQFAEDHAAAHGGWTTTRHHAVPTTDVPLHEIPTLLRWFNDALASRLSPMLSAVFRVSRQRIRVHDAFLVRYDAGRQAHLPLHTDESMLSLTVVLNDGFVGGGTFFADLRRAVSPPIGHVIAFDGRALHGGEPIVRGTRYIVAAFLYVEDDEPEEPDAQAAVRRAPAALESIFAEANAAGRSKRARTSSASASFFTQQDVEASDGVAGQEVGDAGHSDCLEAGDDCAGGFTFNFG